MNRGAGILFIAGEWPMGMLLMRRSSRVKNPHQWGIPGGTAERGETPWETALRETREEAGERAYRLAKRAGIVREGTDRSGFTTFVVFVRREFKPNLNWEHDDWAWVSPQGLTPAALQASKMRLHKGVASFLGYGVPPKSNPTREHWQWKETIREDGTLHSTVHWDSLDDFFHTIERDAAFDRDLEGNKQVYDNWHKVTPNRYKTHYSDTTGRRWDLEFERVRVKHKTRWNPPSRENGLHGPQHYLTGRKGEEWTLCPASRHEGDALWQKRPVTIEKLSAWAFQGGGGEPLHTIVWAECPECKRKKGRRNPRRKGLRATPWGSRRDMDLWTGERWQSSPMDMYPREDRFFQSAYKHYGPNGPCFGGFNQKEASDDLAPLLRKMYEDGKRKGTDMTVGRTRTNPAKKIKRLMELGFTREEALEAMDPWESPPRPRKKRAPTKRKKPRVTKDKDTYLPEEEQLRAQRQAIYETSSLRQFTAPNSPKRLAFRDKRGKRLDARIIRKEGPERLRPFMRNKMFAMGTGVQRRDARIKKGTQTPTEKTILESKARYSDVDKLLRNRQDYEESLGIARKSGFYRITKEPTKSGWEYFVWPLAPGERIPKGYKQRADAIRRATSLERDTNPIYSGKWWTPSKKKYTKRELSEWLPPESYWKKG